MPPADTLQETKDRTIIECMDALVPHIVTGCPVYMSELVGLGGPRAGSRLRAGPALGAHMVTVGVQERPADVDFAALVRRESHPVDTAVLALLSPRPVVYRIKLGTAAACVAHSLP